MRDIFPDPNKYLLDVILVIKNQRGNTRSKPTKRKASVSFYRRAHLEIAVNLESLGNPAIQILIILAHRDIYFSLHRDIYLWLTREENFLRHIAVVNGSLIGCSYAPA